MKRTEIRQRNTAMRAAVPPEDAENEQQEDEMTENRKRQRAAQ
jgi:hypothetical protein